MKDPMKGHRLQTEIIAAIFDEFSKQKANFPLFVSD